MKIFVQEKNHCIITRLCILGIVIGIGGYLLSSHDYPFSYLFDFEWSFAFLLLIIFCVLYLIPFQWMKVLSFLAVSICATIFNEIIAIGTGMAVGLETCNPCHSIPPYPAQFFYQSISYIFLGIFAILVVRYLIFVVPKSASLKKKYHSR